MIEFHVILIIFTLSLFSFFEIIVFNEEILLTLCFLCFLFYLFNNVADSVFDSFEQRASKFEADLLESFNMSKILVTAEFNVYLKQKMFTNQYVILMLSLLKFLVQSIIVLENKPQWLFFQICLTKFNELLLTSRSYFSNFQKTCIIFILYSQLLKKSTNDLTFLTNNIKSSKKLALLKFICLI